MINQYAEGRVTTECTDGVLVVTIARPEVKNALDLESIAALGEIVGSLDRNAGVRALIIRSIGDDVFIAGGDLRQFASLRGREAGKVLSEAMGAVTYKITSLPQVSIAAIDGDAFGGGCELALACDLRVMQPQSHLVFAHAKFGLTPGWGGTSRLVELVGPSRAIGILLQTRRIGATECEAMGLANAVSPEGESAFARAQQMAYRMAGLSRALIAGTKHLCHHAVHASRHDAMAEETRIFAKLWASEAHESRVKEFLGG